MNTGWLCVLQFYCLHSCFSIIDGMIDDTCTFTVFAGPFAFLRWDHGVMRGRGGEEGEDRGKGHTVDGCGLHFASTVLRGTLFSTM